MLKLGNMCHCNSTIWKIDIDTGEIVARADRGAASEGIALYNAGDETWVYEWGPGGNDRVIKWLVDDRGAIGVEPFEEAWTSNPTVFATGLFNTEFSVGDEYLWINDNAEDFKRIDDADGSVDSNATVSGGGGALWDATSSNMFSVSSPVVNLISSALSITTSVTLREACRMHSTGWFGRLTGGTPHSIAEYDNSLSLVASGAAPLASSTNLLKPHQRESSNDKVFCVEWNSTSTTQQKWQLIDVSGLSSDWSITPHDTGDANLTALTADSDVYVVSTGTAIYRLSGSDGSVVWSTTIGSSGTGLGGSRYWLVRADSYLIVYEAVPTGKSITYDGDGVGIIALSASDGSVVWARGSEGPGRYGGRPRIDEGYLYAIGGRGSRPAVPTVVSV